MPQIFWAKAVATACYVLNRVILRPFTKNTPYELFFERKPRVSYFCIFGAKCFILNTKDPLGKFDPKANEGIFVGYSKQSKAYRIFNKRTNIIEETSHVTFDENSITNSDDDDNIESTNPSDLPITNEQLIKTINPDNNELKSPPKVLKDHPLDNIIGDINTKVSTR